MSLDLERLTNEYDAVLVQYKKAKADLSGTKSESKQLVKGQQVMGGQALGETDAKSAEDCSAICASDEKCTGATYKGTLSKCATYSGANLDATPSDSPDDYAIYNANTKLAKSLNQKLVSLNKQIKELSKGKPDTSGVIEKLQSDETELNAEDALLDVELQKRDDMSSAIQETTIQTTMNQYWYWILLAGIILLVGVLIYIFLKPSVPKGPLAPDRYSSSSWSRPSSTSSWSRPSSSSSSYNGWSMPSSSSSSYNGWSRRGGGIFKPGKLKYNALIPGVVMLAATLVASQLKRFVPN
jgi:hypothetical protein